MVERLLWCDRSSDRSLMVDPLNYSCSSQCPTTGITKAVLCVLSNMWDGEYKRVADVVAASLTV